MNCPAFAWGEVAARRGDDADAGAGAGAALSFAIVIPARFASTRYPGKPLAMLAGAGGAARSLIERSWRAASAVAGARGVWVATDDARVADAVRGFGGQVVMTSAACRNGTERCAQAARILAREAGRPFDVIVNFQGDAPLTPPAVVEALVAALADDAGAGMATAALRCCEETYAHLRRDAAQGRAGGVTVVVDGQDRALYFSRRIMPFVPDDLPAPHEHVRLHLGVYAYRARALADYALAAPGALERLEGLEQLRCLGRTPVRVVSFSGLGPMVELNNPQDVAGIERILAWRGIE